MKRKVQTFGINKDYLIKLHRKVIQHILEQGYSVSEEQLKHLIRMSVLQSKVMLFGLSELEGTKNDFNKSILRRFPKGYNGINHLIQEDAVKNNPMDYSRWMVEIMEKTEAYMIRSLRQMPMTEEERAYLEDIAEFETFLEDYYLVTAIPILEELQKNITESLTEIYNDDTLSTSEAIEKSHNILDDYTQEMEERFSGTVQDDLYSESILLGLAGLASLGLDEISEEAVLEEQKIVRYGFVSNIAAYFFNEIRRIKENVVDTLSTSNARRSLATDQIESFSFNRNTFRLSLLTHPRGLFRAIIRKGSEEYSHYKAFVSPLYYEDVNPTGMTAQAAYQIKTPDEWAKFTGYKNINVVGGLSIHHNDTLYYVPVNNTDEDKALAKQQREFFLSEL